MSKDSSVGAGAPPRTAGHTPGPWRLSLDAATGAFAVEDDNRIAVLCSRAAWDHRAGESAANALPIAAAPDLVKALEELLEADRLLTAVENNELSEAEEEAFTPTQIYERIEAARASARSALSLTKG